jgi:hypothetical protein
MNEALENAIDEMKRVDHLYYVSLKYTRTVDMIKHVIERLISTYECAIESLLIHAKEKKLIAQVPTNPAVRSELLKSTYPTNPQVQEAVKFLSHLMRLRRAKYAAREEFRRHVTMIATLDTSEVFEVSIDTLGEYYKQMREFIDYVRFVVDGKER